MLRILSDANNAAPAAPDAMPRASTGRPDPVQEGRTAVRKPNKKATPKVELDREPPGLNPEDMLFFQYRDLMLHKCNQAWKAKFPEAVPEEIATDEGLIPYLFGQAYERSMHPFGPDEGIPIESQAEALNSLYDKDPKVAKWIRQHVDAWTRQRYRDASEVFKEMVSKEPK